MLLPKLVLARLECYLLLYSKSQMSTNHPYQPQHLRWEPLVTSLQIIVQLQGNLQPDSRSLLNNKLLVCKSTTKMLFHQEWLVHLEEAPSRTLPQSVEPPPAPPNTECRTHRSSTTIISSRTSSPLRPPSLQPSHPTTISTRDPNQLLPRTKMRPSLRPKRKPSAWKPTSSRQRQRNRPSLPSSRLLPKLRLKLSSRPLLPRSKPRSKSLPIMRPLPSEQRRRRSTRRR